MLLSEFIATHLNTTIKSDYLLDCLGVSSYEYEQLKKEHMFPTPDMITKMKTVFNLSVIDREKLDILYGRALLLSYIEMMVNNNMISNTDLKKFINVHSTTRPTFDDLVTASEAYTYL